MKKREVLIAFLLFITIIGITLVSINRSYSYGIYMQISGSSGKRVLKYYDENNNEISIDTAVKYYGATRYQEIGGVYFYNGKEITESKYNVGYESEQADLRAAKYGNAGIRVNSTDSFKKAWDNIYNNYISGNISFNWSKYDNINFAEVERYVMTKYGVLDPYQNYYKYELKGPQEPIRFSINLSSYKDRGEYVYNNYNMRLTSDEKKKVDYFLDKLFKTEMPSSSASDYEKIKAAFVYITSHSRYYVDNGFINDTVSGFTSVYDNLLGEHPNNKQYGATNCIGYAVTFSYFMERYGIESYIVDGATSLDLKNQIYTSDHTYNLVKLDNQWYRCDLTFGNEYFLIPMSKGVLYDNTLNLATSKYTSETPTYTFNETNINKYKNEARALAVTTTKKRDTTTTKQPTTTPGKLTTTKSNGSGNNTTELTTTTTEYIYSTTTTTNDYYETTTTTEEQTSSSFITSAIKTTKKTDEPEDKDNKLLFNIILIGVGTFTIVGYIIYKVVLMKTPKGTITLETPMTQQPTTNDYLNQQINNTNTTQNEINNNQQMNNNTINYSNIPITNNLNQPQNEINNTNNNQQMNNYNQNNINNNQGNNL